MKDERVDERIINKWKGRRGERMNDGSMNEWMNECKDLDPGQDFPQVQELKSPSWEQIKYS